MDAARFDDLLRAWQDGEASDAQLQELEAFLRSDPRFRRELVNSVLLEVNLYGRSAKAGAGAATTVARSPLRRRKFLELAAAAIVLGVSAIAVGRLLTRTEAPAHRVLSGDVQSDGAPAAQLVEDKSFEVRGLLPAVIQLKDGSRIELSAASAGVLRGEGQGARLRFELTWGFGKFSVASGARPLRVTTPAGEVWASDADFSLELRPLVRRFQEPPKKLGLAVSKGIIEVEAWGVRETLQRGQGKVYAPPLPPSARNFANLLSTAAFPLSGAIDRALQAAPGVPVKALIESDEGRTVYSVSVYRDGKIREMDFDVKTGDKVDDETETEDLAAVTAALKMTLQDAIDKALRAVPGRAVEAEWENEDGRVHAEIRILTDAGLREVEVDAATGEIRKE